jgi:hypothetical protein
MTTRPEFAAYGRCRSGSRWFWFATLYEPPGAHGWAGTETQAMDAARAAWPTTRSPR